MMNEQNLSPGKQETGDIPSGGVGSNGGYDESVGFHPHCGGVMAGLALCLPLDQYLTYRVLSHQL
jgi:hypothetical protein